MDKDITKIIKNYIKIYRIVLKNILNYSDNDLSDNYYTLSDISQNEEENIQNNKINNDNNNNDDEDDDGHSNNINNNKDKNIKKNKRLKDKKEAKYKNNNYKTKVKK